MKLNKEIILSALSNVLLPGQKQNIVDSSMVKNIQIFGVDVET